MQNTSSESAARAISPATTDPLRAAEMRLAGKRPLRHRRLQQVAADLRNNYLEGPKKALAAHLLKSPADPDALALMAQLATRLGRRQEALDFMARCLAAAPDFAAARFEYAKILNDLNQFDRALAELDYLLADDPTNPLFGLMKANIHLTVGDHERALAICEVLVAEHPQSADCWISDGHAQRAAGNQAACVAAYRRALALRPSSGLAYWGLAGLKTVLFGETDVAALQEQLERHDLAPDDRITLQFCLGKAFEDLRLYDRAFAQYARTNAAKRVDINYDPDTLGAFVAANKTFFTAEFLRRHAGMGNPAPDPIFIVGRPRSGSTLVEQILASHSMIEGTSELPYIQAIAKTLGGGENAPVFGTGYLRALDGLDPAALEALGADYLAHAKSHRQLGRAFFIDKKPANFSHIGLIHLILPNAKIIDARRHPVASGFSMFKLFSPEGKGRLGLAELGRFYRDYVALMAHFDAVLPGKVHRVIYEKMVADPETEVRRLLDYLGLPFEENCLRFYETKRSVMTPSSEQVRKPISTEAVDYWRNFEPSLRPLIKSLGSAFTAYPDSPEDLQ